MRTPAATIKLLLAACFLLGGGLLVLVREGAVSAQSPKAVRRPVYRPYIPVGIPERLWRQAVPAGNPVTAEKVALGEALYFDKGLSADGTVSCATCHDPATAFAERATVSTGVGGSVGKRNAPTVLNVAFGVEFFWDGRVRSLEAQVKQPLVNPAEMGAQSYADVVGRVAAKPEYQRQFRQVFGGAGVTIDTIAQAIAAYERTQLSGNSPFDRFIAGDKSSLSIAQVRGWGLFRGKAQCIACHSFSAASPLFTDFSFHNTGAATAAQNLEPARAEGPTELGRYVVTRRRKDISAFKTPSLRDVELTAPYMHNGSEKTLLDVVKFYNRGGRANPHLDRRMRPLNLTDEELNDLVEFMRALTSDDVLRLMQNASPQTRTPAPLGRN